MRKACCKYFVALAVVLLVSIGLVSPKVGAESFGEPENQMELDNLIEKGYLNSDVKLIDYERNYKEEEEVKTISKDDNLEDYGLMLNEDGEIVSIPEESSVDSFPLEEENQDDTNSISPQDIFYYPGTSITPRKGDIIITSDTFAFGITGHSGIVTEPSIMHFASNKAPGPRAISYADWFARYSNAKVIRLTNSEIVTNAAAWAASKRNSNWEYEINGGISVLDPNYCSKFVYQAFNMGNGSSILAPWQGIIAPYDFLFSRLYPNTSEKVIVDWKFPNLGDF